MFSLIFEKMYVESCGGNASLTQDMRYVITENPGYPRRNASEVADPEQGNSSYICIDRNVIGEFESADDARKHVVAFEGDSYMGKDIARQLSKYPSNLVLGYAPYHDGKTKDGESFGVETQPEGFAVHVTNNSMSPFWFTNRAEADNFCKAIAEYA